MRDILRFGIKRLLILTALCALCVGAAISHREEISHANQIEEQFDELLKEIYPSFRDYLMVKFEDGIGDNVSYVAFRTAHPPEEFNYIYFGSGQPYAGVGNRRSAATGGVLGGPTWLCRDVFLAMRDPATDLSSKSTHTSQMETKVSITIEQVVPWYVFAGSTRTTIYDHGAPENSMFLKLLNERLTKTSIKYEIRK